MTRKPAKPLATSQDRPSKPGLADLRRRLASQPAPAPKQEAPSRPIAEAASEDAAALFRAAARDARPLADSGRAELEAPKPRPVPRIQAAEPAEGKTPSSRRHRAPATEADLLRQALSGVAPLRETGRAELAGPRARPRPGPATPGCGPAEFPAELPSHVDPNDPRQLFQFATEGSHPVDAKGRVHLERPAPEPRPRLREEDERAVLRDAIETPLSFEDRLDMGDEAAFLQAGLPRRVLTDLRRGRWVVQGELDLHGLTREEARATLSAFLAASLRQGLRCLRVIHGKGLGSPGGVGLLKQLSKGWLAQREEILAFCQARPHDGGEGALLVLLRAGAPRHA